MLKYLYTLEKFTLFLIASAIGIVLAISILAGVHILQTNTSAQSKGFNYSMHVDITSPLDSNPSYHDSYILDINLQNNSSTVIADSKEVIYYGYPYNLQFNSAQLLYANQTTKLLVTKGTATNGGGYLTISPLSIPAGKTKQIKLFLL